MKTITAIAAAFLATTISALPVRSGALRPAPDDPALRPADYQPSGDYYDWRKTGRPGRPWFHTEDLNVLAYPASRKAPKCTDLPPLARAIAHLELK